MSCHAQSKKVAVGAQSGPVSQSIGTGNESSPEALKNYREEMAQVLLEGRFDELERTADRLRTQKERFPGGRWKLQYFYDGMSKPAPEQHATGEDWTHHMQLVQQWVEAKPASITARVALAESWAQYAWFVRGTGYADKVTESGWRLFREYTAKSHQVLDDAAKLDAKCPHWYRSMMAVSLAEGWDADAEDALLRKAVAFEPLYYPYYRAHSTYLAPRWNGQPGDIQKFAQQAADRVGGDEGDIIYFEVAAENTCDCSDPEAPIKTMDWERVQRGYHAAEKKYGLSYHLLNQLALMAETVGDSIVADETFQRIGDNVATLIWDDRRFHQVKEWVADVAPMAKLNRDGLKYGSENMKTAVGQQFLAEFQRLTAPAWSGCIAGLKNKSVRPFQVKLRLAEDGTVSGSGTFDSEDMPVIQCLFQTLNSKKPFATKPPKGDYWLLFDVDPAHPVSTAAPVATQAAK